MLPGLELLHANNTEAIIKDELEGMTVNLVVCIPTPGAFTFNKMSSYLEPYDDADRRKDIYYVFYILRYVPIGKQAIVDSIRECVDPREIDALIPRLRQLFSDEYSPGVSDVIAQLSGLDMTEINLRLLVLSEFDEFISLLASKT